MNDTQDTVEFRLNEIKKTNDSIGYGILAGKIFSIHVADGRAFYRIKKVGKKKSKVEWMNITLLNPDKYICPVIGIKGYVNNEYLYLYFGMNRNTDLRIC